MKSILSASILMATTMMAFAQAPYKIVGTSQTRFYNDSVEIPAPLPGQPFYGQDAQYASNTPNYNDNFNGTVNDQVTGLTWQRDYDHQPHKWSEAQSLITVLNNQHLGGYTDWRLPTIKELYSLWNGSKGWPYIDTINFPIDTVQIGHAIFWTSNQYSGTMGDVHGGNPGDTLGAPMVFGVNFGTGHIKAYSILSQAPSHFFRFVRGTGYGNNEFHNNNDGTVSDLATGLMWQQSDSDTGMNWNDALAYVQTKNGANFLGHNDWRLPTTKQLQSLVDYSRSPAATNAAKRGPAIDTVFTCTGIVNEAGAADYPYYLTGTNAKFDANARYYCAWYVAFGRAVDESGEDIHGAGAVRFDSKIAGLPSVPGGERIYNFVRLVRQITATGMNEQDGKSGRLNIYPNPVHDILVVETNILTINALVSIYNIQGQLMLQEPVNQSETQINVSGLSKGIYVLKVGNGDEVMVGKLVKGG